MTRSCSIRSRGIDIDAKGVMRMIPHRYPFLMIDRVENAVADKGCVGIKNVSMNEAIFQGHFPTDPVLPGVLIIEAMAQTAAVLVVHTLGAAFHGKLVYFMSIDNARFRRPVMPGDQLRLRGEEGPPPRPGLEVQRRRQGRRPGGGGGRFRGHDPRRIEGAGR